MCGRKSSPRTEKQFENLICSQLAELSTLQTDLPHCLRHYHKPLPSAWMKTTLKLILLKNLPQSTWLMSLSSFAKWVGWLWVLKAKQSCSLRHQIGGKYYKNNSVLCTHTHTNTMTPCHLNLYSTFYEQLIASCLLKILPERDCRSFVWMTSEKVSCTPHKWFLLSEKYARCSRAVPSMRTD